MPWIGLVGFPSLTNNMKDLTLEVPATVVHGLIQRNARSNEEFHPVVLLITTLCFMCPISMVFDQEHVHLNFLWLLGACGAILIVIAAIKFFYWICAQWCNRQELQVVAMPVLVGASVWFTSDYCEPNWGYSRLVQCEGVALLVAWVINAICFFQMEPPKASTVT